MHIGGGAKLGDAIRCLAVSFFVAKVGLVHQHQRLGPAASDQCKVAFHAAQVEVRSRIGDDRHDIDIRTDVPAYNIYCDGKLETSVSDIKDLWTDDMVVFALGCSFTFENALEKADVPVWHIDNNKTVPMFRSNIDTVPSGPFSGKMVVSMRAIPEDRVDEVIAISRRFPLAHGAPVYWGDPAGLGIADIANPDWGDAAPVGAGEVPVFWACGVTPQVAIETARLPICITHKPGHMLITDVAEDAENPVMTFTNP
jgi:uncharacterized protein YcsI (UPF0317 family)